MIDEVRVAEEEGRPICQDTERVFYAVVLGGQTRVDGDLNRAFLQVTEMATEEVPLRPNSIHPLSRKNLEGKFLMENSLPLPGSGSGNGLSGGDAYSLGEVRVAKTNFINGPLPVGLTMKRMIKGVLVAIINSKFACPLLVVGGDAHGLK